MTLDDAEKQELRTRILADLDLTRFEQVLQSLAHGPAEYTQALDFPTIVDAAIAHAESKEWMPDLLVALYFLYSENDPVKPVGEVAKRLGLKYVSMDGLQALLTKTDAMYDWGVHDLAVAIRRFVCLVEIDNNATGTGVLVGPDYVLTAQHVVEELVNDNGDKVAGSGPRLKLYFDYFNVRKKGGGKLPIQRMEKEVATDWLVKQSPPHPEEKHKRIPPDTEHDITQYDFALLKTKDRVGEQPAYDGQPRGWAVAAVVPRPLDVLQRIHVSQHPGGQMLAGSSGRIRAVPDHRARIRYDASTTIASSGSPCWNNDYQLIAMHNFGGAATAQGRQNQGVPLGRILDALKSPPEPIDLSSISEVPPPLPPTPAPKEVLEAVRTAAAEGAARIWEVGADHLPVLGRRGLQTTLADMAGDDAGQLLVVRGEPGSGKSFTLLVVLQFLRAFRYLSLGLSAADMMNKTPQQVLDQWRGRLGMPAATQVPGSGLTTPSAEIARNLVSGFYADLRAKYEAREAKPGVPMQVWLMIDGLGQYVLPESVHELLSEMLRTQTDVSLLRLVLVGYDRDLPAEAEVWAARERIPPIEVTDVEEYLRYAFDKRDKNLVGVTVKQLAASIMANSSPDTAKRTGDIASRVKDMAGGNGSR